LRKSKIILLSLVLIGLIALSGVLFVKSSNKTQTKNNAATPASLKKDLRAKIGKQLTLSGSLVQGTNKNTYYLISPDNTSATGLQVDFSASGIDPSKYVSGQQTAPPADSKAASAQNIRKTPTTATTKPYTPPTIVVSGKLSQSKPNAPPVLIVTKIQN
jgi:uncharacterized protein YdeI (BOF family)